MLSRYAKKVLNGSRGFCAGWKGQFYDKLALEINRFQCVSQTLVICISFTQGLGAFSASMVISDVQQDQAIGLFLDKGYGIDATYSQPIEVWS